MSEPVPTFEALDEAHEARAIARARASIEAGRGVPHERVRAWLDEFAEGNRSPPPDA